MCLPLLVDRLHMLPGRCEGILEGQDQPVDALVLSELLELLLQCRLAASVLAAGHSIIVLAPGRGWETKLGSRNKKFGDYCL